MKAHSRMDQIVETRKREAKWKSRPGFICVGPEKTGTTWLYANLQPHPQVYLPPFKELRYFYERVWYPGEGWRARFSKDGDWHSSDYRIYLRERFDYFRRNPRAIRREWQRFRWDCRFLFGQRNDRWYVSLFAEAGDRLTGDISPQYLSLPDAELTRMAELSPGVKIIIFLRDPIDWSWSFARMSLIGKKKPEEVQDAEFYDFFDRYIKYYPTVEAIERWKRFFSPAQVYVGFYDSLVSDAAGFYSEICKFLGIDESLTPSSVKEKLGARVYEGRAIPLPQRFEQHLARNWLPLVDKLSQVYSPYPEAWKQRCRRILGI